LEGVRHVNIKGVQPYIDATRKGLPVLEKTSVSRQEAMEDFMMVGLRLLDGVNRQAFREQFGLELEEAFGPLLSRLTRKGLLKETQQGYRLSEAAIMYANDVFGEFVGFFS
jgi:oxygen-independent coproporphyrinogen-3 oxidase